MQVKHFLLVPFTGLGLHNGYRGDAWLKNRIEIFKRFTLQSILNQTDKDFVVWVCWRREENSNPIVAEFIKYLMQFDVYFFHTFHGIPFWDDKYDDETASKRLMDTLRGSLFELYPIVGDERVLLTIYPSDDMYISTAMAQVKEALKGDKTNRSAGWKHGYIMNYATKEIAEYSTHGWKTDHISTYHTDTIPPFFTILFSKDEFLDPEKHYRHIGPYKSHEFIADFTEYTELEGKGFVVGCHGENISTTYNHRYKGRTLTKEETDSILVDTGTWHSEKIMLRLSPRMRIRQLINKVPFSNLLKKMYYLLPGKYRII